MTPEERPDLVLLDGVLSKMGGLTFLKKTRVSHPTPTLITSSLTRTDERVSAEAREYGGARTFVLSYEVSVLWQTPQAVLPLAAAIREVPIQDLSAPLWQARS
jgi:chemotaxis response regulator CheB